MPRTLPRRTLPAMTNQERDAFEAKIAAMSDAELHAEIATAEGDALDLALGEAERRGMDDL